MEGKEENCSLPLMTWGNNISEVRASRCRGGQLERADLTAGCRQPDAVLGLETFATVCIYTLAVGDALLKHCAAIVVHGHNSLAWQRSSRHPTLERALRQRFPRRSQTTKRTLFFPHLCSSVDRESEMTRGGESCRDSFRALIFTRLKL